jgi:hypothetical protein
VTANEEERANSLWKTANWFSELQRLRVLVEIMAIKAKAEPTVSPAEIQRRMAAKKADGSEVEC